MFGFLRWQWLWRSRQRLFVVGLGVFVLGVALLALLIALWASERPNRNIARGIPAPVILMALGGFMMLQAAFSGGGAFGDHDHDDSRDHRRRAWRRKRAVPADEEPIPLAPDTAERPAVKAIRCPTCHQLMTVPADEVAECPKCHERFRPD